MEKQRHKLKKRTIDIDKYGKFVIFGDGPWKLVYLPNDNGFIVVDTHYEDIYVTEVYNPQIYNCLFKLSNKGVTLPTMFVGPKATEIANELIFILNNKL